MRKQIYFSKHTHKNTVFLHIAKQQEREFHVRNTENMVTSYLQTLTGVQWRYSQA